ncbi:MAG: chromate transporter [Christensenellales bacterium]|nr:chromate transporter [Clostridiales bacterium]
MKKKKIGLVKLFWVMFEISAFTFGGGFVIVSLMKKKMVDELGWIDDQEMLDMTALGQSAPGAIAINTSILVGRHLAGIPGLVVSVLGTILPPLIIISIISVLYDAFITNNYVILALRGMQAGVSAVLFDVVFSLATNVLKEKCWLLIILMALVFVLSYFFKVNVVWLLLLAALTGLARSFKKEAKA